ncbi:hypothetical protein ABPG73_019024 [Tetrahymena malaccensis]
MSKKEKKPAPKDVKKVDEKPKINFEELIMKNLSEPKLSIDRTGIHFTVLDLSSKSLDSLQAIFANYKALTKIDLHANNIQDITVLGNLPNLLWLDVSQNNIKDLKSLQNEEGFRNLKYLNISKNRISELLTPKAPNLIHLNLNENLIDKMETFEGHESLKILELRGNRIQTTQQLVNMPKLQELYLTANKIKTVVGIDSLVSLTKLHLRLNNIEQFEENFPNLENLQYLNLRENKIEKFEEILKLAALPNLKTLVHSFNPLINKNPNYLYETINGILKLQRINKVEVTRSLKLNAFKYAEEKWRIQEEEKKRLEEEERLKQEQEQQEEN